MRVGAFEGYIYREVEDDCRLAAIGFSGYLGDASIDALKELKRIAVSTKVHSTS